MSDKSTDNAIPESAKPSIAKVDMVAGLPEQQEKPAPEAYSMHGAEYKRPDAEQEESELNWFERITGQLVGVALLRWIPEEKIEVLDWEEDSNRAMVEASPLRARRLLHGMFTVVVGLLVWAGFADIDQVVRGEGKVIPSQSVQVVQSQDGGVLLEKAVKGGQVVEKGQLLVRLDKTRFSSDFRENAVQIKYLQVKAARLRAISNGEEFVVPADYKATDSDSASEEYRLYLSDIEDLKGQREIADQQLSQSEQELVELMASLAKTKRDYELATKEYELHKPLAASGAVSPVEILRLERDQSSARGLLKETEAKVSRATSGVDEAKQRFNQVDIDFKNIKREELSDVVSRINSLQEISVGLQDRVAQTAIYSPVRGTIKSIHYNTIGGVIQAGSPVLDIVPLDDTLLFDVKITPQDIAFLSPNQKANVKITAYDFAVYGGLEGTLERIGVDTIPDEEGAPFYMVKVRTQKASLGKNMPIIPGMVAQVDILTSKKTVLAYLLKPVLRAKEYALTEQ